MASRYVARIARQLDLPRVENGCTPINGSTDEFLNMVDRMCQANSPPSGNYPLYNAVVQAYQMSRGAAGAATSLGFGGAPSGC